MKHKDKEIVRSWLKNFEEAKKWRLKYIKDHNKDEKTDKGMKYCRIAERYKKLYDV